MRSRSSPKKPTKDIRSIKIECDVTKGEDRRARVCGQSEKSSSSRPTTYVCPSARHDLAVRLSSGVSNHRRETQLLARRDDGDPVALHVHISHTAACVVLGRTYTHKPNSNKVTSGNDDDDEYKNTYSHFESTDHTSIICHQWSLQTVQRLTCWCWFISNVCITIQNIWWFVFVKKLYDFFKLSMLLQCNEFAKKPCAAATTTTSS